MTAIVVLWISLAGGLGALCRYLFDSLIARTTVLPLTIMAINISGSFVAGVTTGGLAPLIPEPYGVIITTGLLGGFTTFSSASVHTAEFILQRQWKEACITGIGQILVSILAAMLGFTVSLMLW